MTVVTVRDLIQRKRIMQQNNLLINRRFNQIRSEVDSAFQEYGEEVQQAGQRTLVEFSKNLSKSRKSRVEISSF